MHGQQNIKFTHKCLHVIYTDKTEEEQAPNLLSYLTHLSSLLFVLLHNNSSNISNKIELLDQNIP